MVFDDSSARDSAIPSPSEGMVVYLKDTNQVLKYVTDWVAVNTGFTASQTITATDATWPVPTLASPIVKVTAIGGGGSNDGQNAGGTGGTTTFDAGGAGTVTALGGGGASAGSSSFGAGPAAKLGFVSANHASFPRVPAAFNAPSAAGGGEVRVGYLDLSGISTVDVTIGAAGSGAQPGSRGEVVIEYVAG